MSSYSIKEILGSKMYLINEDGGLSKQLLKYGIREVGATKETAALLKPGMVVIDIGANLGYYALLEAKMIDNGFVYAIEPVKENVEVFQKSIELNGYKNIKVYLCAIGSENKYEEMTITYKSNCGSLVKKSRNEKLVKERRKVKTITLNDFSKRLGLSRIDFIRMDVEGYEVEIIKGMDQAVGLMPEGAMLSIEIHPKAYPAPFIPILNMLDAIKNYGFKVRKFVIAEKIVKIDNFNKLKYMFDNKFCPQVFFERR
jgi:FkbM family methyltransferase